MFLYSITKEAPNLFRKWVSIQLCQCWLTTGRQWKQKIKINLFSVCLFVFLFVPILGSQTNFFLLWIIHSHNCWPWKEKYLMDILQRGQPHINHSNQWLSAVVWLQGIEYDLLIISSPKPKTNLIYYCTLMKYFLVDSRQNHDKTASCFKCHNLCCIDILPFCIQSYTDYLIMYILLCYLRLVFQY